MKLYLRGHDCKYAAEQMLLTLFPDERPEYSDTPPAPGEDALTLTLTVADGQAVAAAELVRKGGMHTASVSAPAAELEADELAESRVTQRILKLAFYEAARKSGVPQPPWGALTGVRPVKLPAKVLRQGGALADADRELAERYDVTPIRRKLALSCASYSAAAQQSLKADEVSLYVGIPFCPTRCAYCSFISSDVKRALGQVEPYLDGLLQEAAVLGGVLRKAGRQVRTVYIGGGTPTTLTASQLDRLLSGLSAAVDLSRCTEFTVEAGRPDTITAEKLAVLRSYGVGRISVNPQSLNDEVLRSMGRAHTAAQFRKAYALARSAGFSQINADLIAGLPKDTPDSFRATLKELLALAPENITVHTLALKRGSALLGEGGAPFAALPGGEAVAAMLSSAWEALSGAGYAPYYLYRQKYMSGSFENVGWCKPGCESLYNIAMMEELHSVLALGGGGVTKLVDAETGAISRISSPKYPYDYTERLCRVLQDKQAAADFFAAHPIKKELSPNG
ncbi:MAG: coproporphyrinogen dehydrogenase HemZ [Oscillospiraceae bacterium]|nr:coproporphyrinogen dehydrogenase HemZ [Oscillospiraceae bacterium]